MFSLVISINGKWLSLKCMFSANVGIDRINPKTYLKSGYVNFLKNKIIELGVSLIFIKLISSNKPAYK